MTSPGSHIRSVLKLISQDIRTVDAASDWLIANIGTVMWDNIFYCVWLLNIKFNFTHGQYLKQYWCTKKISHLKMFSG